MQLVLPAGLGRGGGSGARASLTLGPRNRTPTPPPQLRRTLGAQRLRIQGGCWEHLFSLNNKERVTQTASIPFIPECQW